MKQLEIFDEWLAQFKIIRILKKTFKEIDGRDLYGYQLSAQEFFDLKNIFRSYKGLSRYDEKINKFYGAAFILLASDFYRREYERQDWGWAAVDEYRYKR